jgi:hypothetical protein
MELTEEIVAGDCLQKGQVRTEADRSLPDKSSKSRAAANAPLSASRRWDAVALATTNVARARRLSPRQQVCSNLLDVRRTVCASPSAPVAPSYGTVFFAAFDTALVPPAEFTVATAT